MTATRYYVTMLDGPRRAFLAGPYPTHDAARAQVDAARRRALQVSEWYHFAAFGTASAEADIMTAFGVAP